MSELHLSTNTQQELDDADVVYTEVGRSIVTPDGSIEHGEPRIYTDRKPKPDPAGQRYLLADLTPEEYAQRVRQFRDVLQPAMRAIDPNYDETIDASSTPLDNLAGRIVLAGTHNGPLVLKWLAQRPAEIERINRLAETNPARAQQKIIQLSAALATREDANLDKADFATFKRVRAK